MQTDIELLEEAELNRYEQEQRARAAMPKEHLAFVDALEKKFGLSAFLFQMGKRVFSKGGFSYTPK